MIDFTHLELVEISDAISAALDLALAQGDPEGYEKRYGMLTVLHEAQTKILPVVFNFRVEDTPWGPARARQIAALRVAQGLPETPSAAERTGWR
jgi:hypothetical protein